MTFANPLPWWAVAGLLAAAAGVTWLAYWRAPLAAPRRATLSAIRFITLLTLLGMLMRPVAWAGPDNPADAVVPILVDTSRSMSIEDETGERRIDRARRALATELLPALSPRFTVDVLAFGETVQPAAPEALAATARHSDLDAALRTIAERYRDRPIAGIVLLSDGGDTSGKAGRGRDGAVPVFPMGIGTPAAGRDREVSSVTAVEAVLDDSRTDLAVAAVSHGYGSSAIELRLLENGRPIEVRRITPLDDGTPVRAVFSVAPPPGAPTVYSVEIPPEAGERVPENNRRSVLVRPPSRQRRVLLVQGAPGFEHSFLRRAWESDSGLEIDSVVRQGKNQEGADTFYIQAAAARGQALASGYPGSRDDLFAYDAVVLANVEGGTLTGAQFEDTRDFVSVRGGGLLVLGAQSFRRGRLDEALEALLPLDITDRADRADRGDRDGRGLEPAAVTGRAANRVALTAAGEAHPIMQLAPGADETRKRWESVPALASVTPLGGPRPGAQVLATTSGPGGTPRALIAVQRYGEGRTMIFAGEASWRWRMLLPAADRSYETFWRQAARWLAAPAADPVSVAVPAGAAAGEVVTLRVAARTQAFEPLTGATVDLRVTRPDGGTDVVSAAPDGTDPGGATFAVRYRADQAGVYRVEADVRHGDGARVSASSAMLVGGADQEMADPRLNLQVLQRIAAASGGHLVEAGQSAALADELLAALPAARLRAQRDLWHNGWSFAAIIALLGAEWTLRRRWGLR